MFKRLIGWILSKLFPLCDERLSKGATMYGKNIDWDTAKAKESELYYGGQNGTIREEKR